MSKEQMRKYLQERFPKKKYRRGIVIRQRKPFELFWFEILFALFIIFLLVMLTMNYVSNLNYVRENKAAEPEKEIDVNADIKKESNLAAPIINYNPIVNIPYF